MNITVEHCIYCNGTGNILKTVKETLVSAPCHICNQSGHIVTIDQ